MIACLLMGTLPFPSMFHHHTESRCDVEIADLPVTTSTILFIFHSECVQVLFWFSEVGSGR